MTRIRVLLVLALTALVAGCGRAEPSATPGEMIRAYSETTDVRNDRYPSTGESGADRQANFAAYYSPEALTAALLGAFRCNTSADSNRGFSHRCDLNADVAEAAREITGTDAPPAGRSLLVRHEDGSLELVTVYVAGGRLIDADGETYTDLEDFRAHNDLLDSDDTVLTLRNITAVPGEGEIVTVTGHTPATWPWWLGGAAVLIAVAGVVLLILRRRAARADLRRLSEPMPPAAEE